MKTGKIIQVMGPVVDVEFEDENLPAIRDALEVLNGDKKSVMEVAQHIGNNTQTACHTKRKNLTRQYPLNTFKG